MAPPTNPGTHCDRVRFPIFNVAWSPSAYCYCGGGGSSKTGIANAIVYVDTNGPTNQEINISTDTDICLNVALHPQNFPHILAAVGYDVRLYDAGSGEIIGRYTTSKEFGGTCTVGFSHNGSNVLVGTENGMVLCFALQGNPLAGEKKQKKGDAGEGSGGEEEKEKGREEEEEQLPVKFILLSQCEGHTKAICETTFDPTNAFGKLHCLSAAKDGTARVWDGLTGQCLATLVCTNEEWGTDPKKKAADAAAAASKSKKPVNAARQKRMAQILVRGCVYGPNGLIYTIASGRRGKAYVSQWAALAVPQQQQQQQQQPPPAGGGPPPPPNGAQQQPPQPPTIQYREVGRVCCSPVPVSSLTQSTNKSTLILGNCEGSIIFIDAITLRVQRTIEEVHDLPVTGMSPRPSGYDFTPGGQKGSLYQYAEVITVSADSRLVFLSRRREPIKTSTIVHAVLTLILLALVLYGSYVSCGGYIDTAVERHGVPSWEDLNGFGSCVVYSVVAPPNTPGVYSMPY